MKFGVHYMLHFAVLNPESKSTKLRIVVDSACKNKHSNLSFNDLMRPVPNSLNDITDVQLRWRAFPHALNYDLSKAYHTRVVTFLKNLGTFRLVPSSNDEKFRSIP